MRLTYFMLLLAGFAVGLTSVTGCGSKSDTASQTEGTEVADHDQHAEAGHDHGGWWCTEHGVPEEECALCDTSLVTEFKEKGDWCDKHDRPESQCFLCDETRFERFAARYEAKFGEQPPKPTE